MLRELENLLRDIAEQNAGVGGQPAARPSPAPVRDEPIELVDAEIIDAEPVRSWRDHSANEPIHRLDADDITQHADHLGAEVGQADEKLDARIHSKFDHDLSKLDDAYKDEDGGDTTTEHETPALDVAGMLRDPRSISQAIILSEVLNRPLDRW
jgi:hypothetical protein